jgi:hypothetical protein
MSEKTTKKVDANLFERFSPLPEQLVDREKQLNDFKMVLSRITHQGSLPSNLFEWYGSPGIGKTMLVSILSQECEKRHIPWILVNFKENQKDKKDYLRDPILLIDDMVTSLAQKAMIDVSELRTCIKKYRETLLPSDGIVPAYYAMKQDERLYNRPDWLNELRNVIIAFLTLVNGLGKKPKTDSLQPLSFFFDETEYADVELVDWIEEWVVNPLTQMKHCIVVWTARRPWRWKRPEIRRRLTSEALDVFDPDQVKQQIMKSGSTNPDLITQLFKNVHVITGGHPFANRVAIDEISILVEQGQDITPETFPEYEAGLLREIFDQFIDGYVLHNIESSELKVACKFLSMVRFFDTTMLREVLQTCAGELFKSWHPEDFGNLLLRLKKTQLLVWEKGYALDPGLRHIIRRYYMVADRRIYVKANQAALRVYADWLSRPVDNRCLFVIEELYHFASLQQVEGTVDLQNVLEKRLEEYPNWTKGDRCALNMALEHLEGELRHDKVLEQLTEGLSSSTLAQEVQIFKEAHQT